MRVQQVQGYGLESTAYRGYVGMRVLRVFGASRLGLRRSSKRSIPEAIQGSKPYYCQGSQSRLKVCASLRG